MAYNMCNIVLILLVATFSVASALCTTEDQAALVAIRNSFPAKSFPNSWYIEDNCCFWDGVGCANSSSGRVTSLYINGEEDDSSDIHPSVLKGPIPPAIGDLSALDSLGLSSLPGLTGSIPDNLRKLTGMKYFIIYNTSVSGSIPSFLSQFASLLELEINFSKLSGTIPASLGELVNLWTIDFSINKLTGTIPGTLFSKLKAGVQAKLGLSGNKLTGAIPQSFGSIKWKILGVSHNKLCGPLPKWNHVPADGFDFTNNKCLCGAPLPACK